MVLICKMQRNESFYKLIVLYSNVQVKQWVWKVYLQVTIQAGIYSNLRWLCKDCGFFLFVVLLDVNSLIKLMQELGKMSHRSRAMQNVHSSMHRTDEVSGKPKIIKFFPKERKGGGDSLNQKCMIFSTSHRIRRYSTAIFFGILSITGVNYYVLFTSFKNNHSTSCFNFLKVLVKQLCLLFLQENLVNNRLPENNISKNVILKKDVMCSDDNRIGK